MSQSEMLAAKGWLPVNHAAKKAGVSIYAVYRWIHDKKVQSMQVGGHWYLTLDSLAKHLGAEASAALGLYAPAPPGPEKKAG